jgi:hypothetical protein
MLLVALKLRELGADPPIHTVSLGRLPGSLAGARRRPLTSVAAMPLNEPCDQVAALAAAAAGVEGSDRPSALRERWSSDVDGRVETVGGARESSSGS